MSNELITMDNVENKSLNTRDDNIHKSLLSKENFQHYMAVADFLSKSDMVPKGMKNKPADILIAMEMGLQVGLPMMQAIQDIAVINGKPSMYGDAPLAVVQRHSDYEWIKEEIIKQSDGNNYASCTLKRKNHEPHTVTFSIDNAKKASLWGKQGVWSQYPERMLQMRARGFCIRDIFSDALKGIKTDEDVSDYESLDKSVKVSKSKSLLNKITAAKGQVIEAETIDTDEYASDEQLAEIHMLLAVKEFEEGRLQGALEHYKVEKMAQLTSEQAHEFIGILTKLSDKD